MVPLTPPDPPGATGEARADSREGAVACGAEPPAASAPVGITVEAHDLSVTVAGLPLLTRAHFVLSPGQLTLLVGPSGVGKSILLQILAGVLRPGEAQLDVSGQITLAGTDIVPVAGRHATREVGLVFQDHALLDDLSCTDNILFAIDHRRPRLPHARRGEVARELLSEFGLESAPHVRALSGGQRQRLAVARTLAHDPAILLYDEPTTGLDAANARRVAQRIAATHRRHRKTSLIVTHDYAPLLGIVDQVLLLDPRRREIREISPDRIPEEMEALGRTDLSGGAAPAHRTRRVARALASLPAATTNAVLALLAYLLHLVPRFPRLRWGVYFLYHELRLLAFPSSLVYMTITGIILGFVSTYFTFRYLPHRTYSEPLLADEVLSGLGFILYRVLAPVLATLLIAARCGAAVTSDTGNRAYARQLDAMKSLGIAPSRYLLTAIGIAFLFATPVLCAIVFVVARWLSLIVFDFTHPEHSAFFWDLNFHKLLWQEGSSLYVGSWWLLAKIETAGAGIAAIAYHLGARRKKTGADVSLAVTSAIIWATLWVLAVHFVYSFLEF